MECCLLKQNSRHSVSNASLTAHSSMTKHSVAN